MIVAVLVGEDVFDTAFFSVLTFYIVHRFHLSMSNATLVVEVVDSSPLCGNNDLLTARQYFSGVMRWKKPWIHSTTANITIGRLAK